MLTDLFTWWKEQMRDKFGLAPEELQMALSRIDAMTERVTAAATLDVVKEDPTDNRIFGVRASWKVGIPHHARQASPEAEDLRADEDYLGG